MTLSEALQTRRSVFTKHFTGEEVPNDVIEKALINAHWAPTHKKTEPWRFVVFTKDSIPQYIQAVEQYLNTVTFETKEIEEVKRKKLILLQTNVSHIIGCYMKRDSKERVPKIEEICSTAAAIHNLLLTIHELGYGGYWSTGNGTYSHQMRNFLGLNEEDEILGFCYIGVPDSSERTSKRSPIESVVEWR
ncbi:MAG: nitroreductase [Candidatus Kapabacteria bacterium]|nr:nitroreductase [Candidatus Kapabacteria bacterium]